MIDPALLVTKLQAGLRRLEIGATGLVVAVSGGPDSVALLRALSSLRANESAPLIVAHFNHQLRGPGSDADEAFVRDLCERGLPTQSARVEFCSERFDVAAEALSRGGNLEDVARQLRYDWLARLARTNRVQYVATGHTADDQAETVLHHLLRGTGLKGLRGIAPRRSLAPDVEVIRPLLAATRREVLAYLAAEGQPFREDSSNSDCRFTRNRLRHELLPHLAEHYNPAIAQALCRLAEQASEAYMEQEEHAGRVLRLVERPRAGTALVFEQAGLAEAGSLIVRECFRKIWTREGWPLGEMGFSAWERLAGLAAGTETALDLPGGVRARRRGQVILLERV